MVATLGSRVIFDQGDTNDFSVGGDMLTYGVAETVDLAVPRDLVTAVMTDPSAVDAEVTMADLVSTTARYVDTAERHLFHAGIEVWRQEGGSEQGWHLSAQLSDGSTHAVRLPLGRSDRTVPIRLRRLIWAVTRDAALEPVLLVSTTADRADLSVDGRRLASLSVVRVSALPGAERDGASAAEAVTWQQIVVDVAADEAELGKRVDRRLRRLGATRSRAISPLSQGEQPESIGPSPRNPKGRRQKLSPDSPAAAVIVRYLTREVERLRLHDLEARLDAADGIHLMRVATRRLRTAFQAFGALVPADVRGPLAVELKWLAGELGLARDAEVLRARLLAAVSGPRIRPAVDRVTRRHQREAFSTAMAALDSERYRLLVAALDELVARPALTKAAKKSAGKQLRRPVAAAYDAVHEALRTADSTLGAERDSALHEARKAAKRARYAAEALVPAFGRDAQALAREMERLQEILGQHQDSVVLQDRLLALAVDATPAAAFAYGQLHAAEGVRQAELRPLIERVGRSAQKKSLRRWLT